MSMESNPKKDLQVKIEEIIAQEGLDLVDFKFSFYGGGYSLRCLVDYPCGGISIDKCAEINAKIVGFLEESSLLGENFTVEVNSPGLDCPLKNYKDFLRAKGSVVGVWLNNPVEAKTYLEGEIVEANEHNIVLRAKDKTYTLEPAGIKLGKARLDLKS